MPALSRHKADPVRSRPRPQFQTPDFTTDSFGQLCQELYLARVFVRGSDLFAVLLQFVLEFLARSPVLAQHNEGFDDLPARRIGTPHDRGLHHRRMLDEGALHFERADAVTGALDNIVPAAYEPKIARRVALGTVA